MAGIISKIRNLLRIGTRDPGRVKLTDSVLPEARIHTEYTHTPIIYTNWTGEKNYGELGAVSQYYMDYPILALRSWQAYIESDIAQLIVNDMLKWTLGFGLRLEAQPKSNVLKSEGIDLSEKQSSDFSQLVEDRFNLHANSRKSTYSRTMTLHGLTKEILKHAMLSGDCLCIIREYANEGINLEMIDGQRVVSPIGGNYNKRAERKGNKIMYGVEVNPRGGHVAYYVRKENNAIDVMRIPVQAKKTGRTQAFLVYGTRYRAGYVRGLPLLSGILETLKKMDRYKEAMVGSAEERAKIVMQIIHENFSTGENPTLDKIRNAISLNDIGKEQDQTRDFNIFDETAQAVASTSGKEVYNMPVGAELKALESKQELYFKDFMSENANMIFSAMDIPPEVARKVYNSNYSASRMAIKSWEYSLIVRRDDFAAQCLKPVYNSFLSSEILKGKISAPGYLQALLIEKNHMIIEAYRSSRWIGANVPSVDPVKEVAAQRAMLGPEGANVPLTTPEKATEHLGQGDYKDNEVKFDRQTEKWKENPDEGSSKTPVKNLKVKNI